MLHESMKRLLDFARDATQALRPDERVATFASIGRRLGVSAAVMTNWKDRGISLQGALDAQRVFGCSATWLLDGEGPQRVNGWPFPRVQQSRWDLCSDEDRGYMQAVLNQVLDECEARRFARHAGNRTGTHN